MAKVTIDNVEIEVPDGTTILNAARMLSREGLNEAGDLVPPFNLL